MIATASSPGVALPVIELPHYVLLTAAKNEAAYIEHAIHSVLNQSWQPLAWFIVDDGSTDETAKLVGHYAAEHPFIHLVSLKPGSRRSFGSKCAAIEAAHAQASPHDFKFVGIHDADIEVAEPRYYEGVLRAFMDDPALGVAGGYIFERPKGAWQRRLANSPDSVAGGIQMFRRVCFEHIGGYTSMPFGGEDWLAEIDARRAGWTVRVIPKLAAYHHRPTSSADGRIRGLFRLGMMDGSFGSHPVFEVLKCLRRIPEKPRFIGTLIRLAGYFWYFATNRGPILPTEKSRFLRTQQVRKLQAVLTGELGHLPRDS